MDFLDKGIMKEWVFQKIKTEHVRYAKTYLQNVIVSLEAESFSAEENEARQRMEKYLSGYFNIDAPKPMQYPHMPVNVSAQNEDVELFFKDANVVIRYGGEDYLNFKSSILPQLYRMKSYLQEVVGENQTLLTIRKINIWPLKAAVVDGPRVKEITHTLLNPIIDSWVPNEWNGENLDWNFVEPDHNDWTVRVAIRLVENDIQQKMFVLDTTICNKVQVQLTDAENMLIAMNDVLYEVYHGCVSDRVIQTMKGGR